MLTFRANTYIQACGWLCGLWLLYASSVLADERILDYQSDITIHTDGNLIVTETIRVRAEGQNIRNGIYRDFPTRYTDRFGNHYQVELDVQDVYRNGSTESFHTEKRSNGIRIYFGNSSQMLSPGIHEYRLRFHTNRQLGFFENHDELYWNVTGSGWAFPIDHASARIVLPSPVYAQDLRTDFYTGHQGEAGKDAESQLNGNEIVTFNTTRPLATNEGLTVVVGWPKGLVNEPGLREKAVYFLKDNDAALILLLGLLAPLAWYLWAWYRHGRDPQKGIIIPRFRPPTGLTPAGCSYIQKMSFNRQAFSAAVVSLGIKGYLDIHEEDGEFELHLKKRYGNGKASKGEEALMDKLFSEEQRVELVQKNHRVFMEAQAGLKKALKAEHLGRVFNLNARFALAAVLMSIVAVIIATQLDGGPLVWIAFGVLSVALHISFLLLLRAPTPAGRHIMDEIEGFKIYLDTAEQERLERMKSPQLTPEVFESFLPYAFALGVENSWCDRFTREFPEALAHKGSYQPAWYSGNHSGMSALGHLGNDFNSSFSSAISSASTPPGSSSGSSGGGSSGGGGGGGGGGGW
jgi:uncharacterized membrane protein YgcG